MRYSTVEETGRFLKDIGGENAVHGVGEPRRRTDGRGGPARARARRPLTLTHHTGIMSRAHVRLSDPRSCLPPHALVRLTQPITQINMLCSVLVPLSLPPFKRGGGNRADGRTHISRFYDRASKDSATEEELWNSSSINEISMSFPYLIFNNA